MNNVIDTMIETGIGLVFTGDFLEEVRSELKLKRKHNLVG